jgi:hypothetical protein
VTAALTLTLAFCAVQARSHKADADRAVRTETAAIAGFARIAARAGAPAEALPPAIRAYVASIVADEFHGMTASGRSPATQRRAEALEEAAYVAAASMLAARSPTTCWRNSTRWRRRGRRGCRPRPSTCRTNSGC